MLSKVVTCNSNSVLCFRATIFNISLSDLCTVSLTFKAKSRELSPAPTVCVQSFLKLNIMLY